MWSKERESAIRAQISEDLRLFGLDTCQPIALATRKLHFRTKEIRAMPTAPLIDLSTTQAMPTEVQ